MENFFQKVFHEKNTLLHILQNCREEHERQGLLIGGGGEQGGVFGIGEESAFHEDCGGLDVMEQIDGGGGLLDLTVVVGQEIGARGFLNGGGERLGERIVWRVPHLQASRLRSGKGVHVDADEDAIRRLVGKLTSCGKVERFFSTYIIGGFVIQKCVLGARQKGFDAVGFEQFAQLLGNLKVEVLFECSILGGGSPVLTSVTRIENDRNGDVAVTWLGQDRGKREGRAVGEEGERGGDGKENGKCTEKSI